jgi:hypothetical protein
MKIVRRLIYFFFILLLLIAFVFFGGGSTLVRVGKRMEEWELSMKKSLGGFCQQGQKRIKAKADRVTGKITKRKNVKK